MFQPFSAGGVRRRLSDGVAWRASTPLTAGELRLGTAAVKITPPLGTPMAGYYSARGSQGVLDDLYAKAAVLDDGKTKAAMVVCDLIGLPRAPVLEARRIIAEKTGIPADNVMISATHTHTGPVVIGDTAIDDLVTGGSKLSKDYAEQLPKWIAQAVEEAYGRRTPARVFYASENEPKLSFIRRFWMKDGTVGWNPGSAESEYHPAHRSHRSAGERRLCRNDRPEAARAGRTMAATGVVTRKNPTGSRC